MKQFGPLPVVLAAAFVIVGCGPRTPPDVATGALVEVLRYKDSSAATSLDAVIKADIRTAEDVNTVMGIANSYDLRRRYWQRLEREDLARRVAEPYLDGREYSSDAGFAAFNARFAAQAVRLSLLVEFRFAHQDPKLAADVANQVVKEFLAYEAESTVRNSQSRRCRLVSEAFPPLELN